MTIRSLIRHAARSKVERASVTAGDGPADRVRALHIVVDFDGRESAGRFVIEVGRRAPGIESHVCTNRVIHADGDVTVHEVGGRPATFAFTRWRRIRRLIASLGADIVHLHGGILLPLVARSPAFRRVPLVLSVYAWPELAARDIAAVLWHSRHQRKSSTSTLMSSVLPQKLVGRLFDGTPTHGVLTPDPALMGRLREVTARPVSHTAGGSTPNGRSAVFDPRSPTIAFAGRAEKARGLDTLIEAMPSVLERVPGARLRLLILPSNELADIRTLVRSHRVDAHVTIETQRQPDLQCTFGACTIGAFPFKHDYATLAPPLTVIEAMSVGLPIVATPVACMEPIVRDDVNGLLVPRNDPLALADAIVRVVSDRKTWQRMSESAHTAARQWTWDNAARATTAVYRSTPRP
jgi:starch synthase